MKTRKQGSEKARKLSKQGWTACAWEMKGGKCAVGVEWRRAAREREKRGEESRRAAVRSEVRNEATRIIAVSCGTGAGQGQSRPSATPWASDDNLYENGPRAQNDN